MRSSWLRFTRLAGIFGLSVALYYLAEVATPYLSTNSAQTGQRVGFLEYLLMESQDSLIGLTGLLTLAYLSFIAIVYPMMIVRFLLMPHEESAYANLARHQTESHSRPEPGLELIEERLTALELIVSANSPGSGDTLSLEEKQELLKNLRNEMKRDLSADLVRELTRSHKIDLSQSIISGSLDRLGNQVSILGLRANRTLMLGILFTVTGLGLLFATFFYFSSDALIEPDQQSWISLFAAYLPRLSIVLITELVGFYFLRLYSLTLADLRIVQNEITNVELKLIALLDSSTSGLEAVHTLILELFARTERNAIIEKTQTTVEIERERATAEAQANAIKIFTELLHGTEKGWFWKKRE